MVELTYMPSMWMGNKSEISTQTMKFTDASSAMVFLMCGTRQAYQRPYQVSDSKGLIAINKEGGIKGHVTLREY